MKRTLTKWPVIIAMLLLITLVFVSVSFADKDTPMVGKWMLDGNGLDSSGYGNHGTAVNNPTVIDDGVHRQAYRFDRNDQEKIEVPNCTYLNFGTGSFSLSCWFRITQPYLYNMTMVDKRGFNGTNLVGYQICSYRGGNVIFRMSDTGGTTSYIHTAEMADSRWHNVIVIVNKSANTVRMYVDGILAEDANGAPRTGTMSNYFPFLIGGSSTNASEFFNGDIDEVLAYRTALSADEAKEIYMNGAVYHETFWYYRKCQAKWNMDGNALDSSGNINNGVLHGGPLLPEIVDGVHNWALFFNGTNYISVPDDPTLNLGMTPRGAFGELTISFWVRPSNEYPGGTTIIDKRSIVNGSDTGYLVQLYGQRPLLQLAEGAGWLNFYSPTGVQLNFNEWYFVAFTVDRYLDRIYLYIYRSLTGVLSIYSFDCSALSGDFTNTAELYIAKNHDVGNCFVGTLDDIKIYNKCLALDQVEEQCRAHQ